MSDSIYRHEAIKIITSYNGVVDKSVAKRLLLQMPSASTELSNNSPKLDNKNGELISRQDAVRDIRSMDVCVMYDDACSTEEAVEKAIVATKRTAIFGLECLPSAQPRKKGKWIRTRTMTHDGELYCSECEQEHPEQKIIWNFCPNCGSYNGGKESE